jgi:hypothetical protein
MPQYKAPSARVTAQRMVAAQRALDDLTPEARAEVDAMLFRLRDVDNLGPNGSLEVIAAVAMLAGRE